MLFYKCIEHKEVFFMNEVKELNQKEVTIKGQKYILRSEFPESGPHFSIWDILYSMNDVNRMYAEAFLTWKGFDKWEFDIIVFDNNYKRCGLGTFLVKNIVEWCSQHSIDHIYGYLSGEDYSKGNWKISLPFYKKLPRKVKYIKKCYFLSSLDALLPTKKYKDYKVNLKNALKGEAVIVLFIIN